MLFGWCVVLGTYDNRNTSYQAPTSLEIFDFFAMTINGRQKLLLLLYVLIVSSVGSDELLAVHV